MHLNYYFLKRLTKALSTTLTNAIFIEAFSQQRDELIILFNTRKNKEFIIRATLQSDFSCLSFPEEFHRSRKNSVNLFRSLENLKTLNIKQYLNERAFSLSFENNYTLLFKLHGNRSNIILFSEKKPVELFKNSLTKDKIIDLDSLDRPIHHSLEKYLGNPNFQDFFPTFGKPVKKHLDVIGFQKLSPKEQWIKLVAIEKQLENGHFFLSNDNTSIGLNLVSTEGSQELGKDPIAAVNLFYKTYTANYYFHKEKERALKYLHKQLEKAKNYIQNSEQKYARLKASIKPGQIADIIMANLHTIKPGATTAELFNFYTNQFTHIKLNKNLSPQKNAESYYRKGKNRKIEEEKIKDNIEKKKAETTQVLAYLSTIEKTGNLRELKKFLKAHKLIQQQKGPENTLPYKSFEIEGYQVFVGKNAKANDQLTLKHSYKEDLWLHAKDVAGSHVLVKYQSGKVFPTTVIEKAASLAAFYSKRKNDTLAPVIYTPAKYVRKPKGSLPGQVIISKEQVVLVPPKSDE